jgi:hypothetical protein
LIARNENTQGVLLESAARTATTYSEIQENDYWRGVKVFINCTAKGDTATPSVTFTVQERDHVGGGWRDILTSAAVTDVTTSPTVLVVYPGNAAVSNKVSDEPLSREWRIKATHADTDSVTYSVSYCYII